MRVRQRIRVWLFGALWVATGCGEADAAGAKADHAGGDGEPSFDGGSQGGGDPDDGAGNGGALPPEQEETLSFELPQAGATSVYIPNGATNRVAVVNATTFAIETVKVGQTPTYTATVPGKDVALVLNIGTRDASLLRTMDGSTRVRSLPVGHAANAIAIAPDARHAVIYFDARNPDQAAQSFQDVTVVDLTTPPGKETARGVSVGFRPRGVAFSSDGDRAFVITEDGISVIDLDAADDGPVIATLISVGDAATDPVSSDVTITPDGRYALARPADGTKVRLIDLGGGGLKTLDLTVLQMQPAEPTADAGAPADEADAGGPPLDKRTLAITDLDIAPDGTFAIAVARSHSALIRIPIPAGFSSPVELAVTPIPGQVIGSVAIANSGKLALAYTTAAPIEGITIVDLAGDAPLRSVRLRKSVRAVAMSSDGARALVLHTKGQGAAEEPGIDEEVRIDRSEGYSLIDTATGFAKLQLTSSRVNERDLVLTKDPKRMFALLRDDRAGVSAFQMANLESFQIATTQLVAPPSSIGLVPGVMRLFIGQELAGGMITFVNTESGAVEKAVTGFELTSRIRQ